MYLGDIIRDDSSVVLFIFYYLKTCQRIIILLVAKCEKPVVIIRIQVIWVFRHALDRGEKGFCFTETLQGEVRIPQVEFHIRDLAITEVYDIGLLILAGRICKV